MDSEDKKPEDDPLPYRIRPFTPDEDYNAFAGVILILLGFLALTGVVRMIFG